MNAHNTICGAIPDADTRARLNTHLHAAGADSGFWNEHGRPAPWPDDIDEWRPTTDGNPITLAPGEPPF
jgi:hypothetical protein